MALSYSDFSGLLGALPGPALLIAQDERIAAMNPPAAALLGAGLLGRHYITALRQPAILDCIEQALKRRVMGQARFLLTAHRRDTTWKATAGAFEAGTLRGVLLTFEDVTAMEEAGQMRRDFVANVSHELRTPLTALSGFIETLKGAARDDAGARARFLEIMTQEAARMDRLVNDLLSLSRVEADERVRPTTEIDLAAALRSVLGTLEPLASQREVTLVSRGLEAPIMVQADADQIRQVFTNLVENAVKYGRRGGEVTLAALLSERDPALRGPSVRIDVIDQGEGIDPLQIPRLTERFYRVDTHRSREMGGTGLGLAIVKHIVGRHRGRLRIDSTPGQGSTFSVILPAD